VTQAVFHGSTFVPDLDQERLESQLSRVFKFTLDKNWHTLREISDACHGSEASVSARLRDIRNQLNYNVERRRRGDPHSGLFEYRVSPKWDEKGQGVLL